MCILTIAAALAFLQQTGSITGTIVEARTGAPLAAVLVKVQSSGQQAFSDGDGKFEIKDVPTGAQTLLVSVVNYGLVRRDVVVDGTNGVNITIAVNEGASTYVEEVSVGGDRFREAEPGVSTQSVLGSRELLALRGLVADDPFRAVQVLPGVATGDDFRAEFALRGLGSNDIGISIDGVDSPLLFHTVRGVQDTGSVGLINSDILESASLLAGAHPQRLNSHLGSRLDFTTRDGSRDRLTVRALVSASAASTVWEGPLGSNKNATWLFAARKSYIDWLLRMMDNTSGTTFGFTDTQAKVTWQPSPRQTVRVSFIGGQSVLREVEDTSPGPNTLERAANGTVIGNVQWQFTPGPAFTTSQQVYLLAANYGNRVIDGRTREEGSDRDLTWRGSAQWNPRRNHLIEFGAQAQSLQAERIDRRFTTAAEQLILDAKGDAWSAAGWAQYRWTPAPGISITPGVRLEHWRMPALSEVRFGSEAIRVGGFDRSAASPWVLSDFEIRSGTRLRVSAGVQHQGPTIDASIFAQSNDQLVPERSATVEAGIEQRIGSAWRVNVSAYHRHDDDRLRAVNNEVRIDNDRIVVPTNPYLDNVLTGDTSGAEFVVERRAVTGLNGWVSYAWSDSQLEDVARAETFPADYDQRHTINAYIGYRWGGRTNLSMRYRYGSNFPIAGYVGADAAGYVLASQRNGIRLPDYSRLDLRADQTFTYRKSRLTLFIEVVNATNHDNYRQNGFSVNNQRRVFNPIESMFPLLPVAGVLVEF